jgi:hypothetical protein
MKHFTSLRMMLIVPAFFYSTFPSATDASLDQGTGSAILKVAVAVLVGGVFVYSHFRDRVHVFIRNLLSRAEKREGTEG